MYDYVFKNDKYDILGFKIKSNQIDYYNYDLIVGNKSNIGLILNINSKVIGLEFNEFFYVSDSSIVLENELLYVVCFDTLYVIDIDKIQLKYNIDLNSYSPLENIYKFNGGILICGELDILFLKGNNILWSYSSSSWFNDYEILGNKIKLIVGDTNKEIIIDSYGKEIK